MEEILIDAVSQFIKGSSWLDPIDKFSRDNADMFTEAVSATSEFNMAQHQIYRDYEVLVEELIDGIVSDLGCSSDLFVKALGDKISRNAQGAQDEMVNELIEALLAYDDFKTFAHCMHSYAVYIDEKDQGTNEDSREIVDDVWSADWLVQETLAQSILDANENGSLGIEEVELVPWAKTIVEMKELRLREEQIMRSSQKLIQETNTEKRIRELESTLAQERLKVDLLVAQRMGENNAQLRNQVFHADSKKNEYYNHELEEEWNTENTIPNEHDEMTYLLHRMEDLRIELEEAKYKCFQYTNISEEALGEIYLFLKEKIHFKYDLATCQEEIHSFIFERVNTEDASIVSDMLTWLLLESEGQDNQRRMNEILSGEYSGNDEANSTDSWTQAWDEDSQSYYYVNTETDASIWEEPKTYWGLDEQWHMSDKDVKDSYTEESDLRRSTSLDNELYQMAEQAAEKNEMDSSRLSDIGNALEEALSSRRTSNDTDSMERELERISREHDEERQRLEITLQVEKARQKQEIQRRKEKRRRARMRKIEKEAKADAKSDEKNEEGCQEKPTNRAASISAPPAALKPIVTGLQLEPLMVRRLPNLPAISGQKALPLKNLLTKSDALRRGDGAVGDTTGLQDRLTHPNSAMLNPTSLKFLSKKVSTTWSSSTELLLDLEGAKVVA